MAWDDTDNEEYEEEYDDDEEDFDDDDDGEVRFPSTPYEELYDMRPIEEVNGWILLGGGVLDTKIEKISLENKKPNQKKSPIVFDLQNLDVPEDKNGRKKVR